MPFIQFYGNFKFQVPYYNNDPTLDAESDERVLFNTEREPPTLRDAIYGDYKDYFKFELENVKVKGIIYDDASALLEKEMKNDGLLNNSVLLHGFLADISPHLEYGRFYPIVKDKEELDYRCFGIRNNEGTIILSGIPKNIFSNTGWAALQSELHKNIRSPKLANEDERFRYSANFHTTITDLSIADKPEINSRCLNELGDTEELALYLQLSRFNFKTVTGDISGYLGPVNTQTQPLRFNHRRIILNPMLMKHDDSSSQIRKDFVLDELGEKDLKKIQGSYDILQDKKLLVLRFLDFVPYVGINKELYYPPIGYKYTLYFQKDNEYLELVERSDLNEENMQFSGGIIVTRVPDKVVHDNEFALQIDVIKDNRRQNLMLEPDIDLTLSSDCDRGVVMYSAEEKDIFVNIYSKNILTSEHKVYLSNQEENEQHKSPIIARFRDSENFPERGEIRCTVRAIDLENVGEHLFNPVDGKYYGPKVVDKSLPWNQYYGNFLRIDLKNEIGEISSSINIAVRVIHKVVPDPSTIPLENINWNNHIFPLFEYYIRYYPWLHVTFNRDFARYEKKFDLKVQFKVRNKLTDVIDRLEMEVTAEKKMPRSRDFPKGGIELIKRWRQSLL